jgi:hypothetical protein
MPALNYQKRFADDVESGRKRQTIRATRKRPIRPGDTLYQYTGMRTKGCRKLREDICKETKPINMKISLDDLFRVIVGVNELDHNEMEGLALADGFKNVGAFYEFFKNDLPFAGDIIFW